MIVILQTLEYCLCVDVLQLVDGVVQRRYSHSACAQYLGRRHCPEQAIGCVTFHSAALCYKAVHCSVHELILMVMNARVTYC